MTPKEPNFRNIITAFSEPKCLNTTSHQYYCIHYKAILTVILNLEGQRRSLANSANQLSFRMYMSSYDLVPPSHEECNRKFFRKISGGVKRLLFPHLFATYGYFGMQFKSNHLIRQVIEIQFLELHSLLNFFQTQNCTFHGTEGVLCTQ